MGDYKFHRFLANKFQGKNKNISADTKIIPITIINVNSAKKLLIYKKNQILKQRFWKIL